MSYRLSVNRCPHGTYSVALDSEGSGTRLTPSNCCGRWDLVKEWKMDADDLRNIIVEMECAVDEMERSDGDQGGPK